jgi:hypothetical protein
MSARVRAAVNTMISLNRLGRGNAALFLLLSYGAIGTGISIVTHLVLAHTAALWYNGLNDLLDLEIDRTAYAKSPYRKVLLNGAMTARGLQVWLIVLLAASVVLLIADVRANLWSLALFAAGILSSVVYNRNSKYLAHPSIAMCIALDVVVAGPFYFYYASLVVAAQAPPDLTLVVGTIGSLVAFGLYGNFIFAAKDMTTDATSTRTLPMLLGSTVDAQGTVRHSTASKAYLGLLFALIAGVFGYVAFRGYWFALLFAGPFLIATVALVSGRVTERGHKKVFVRLSNWEMVFLLSLYVWTIESRALAQLVVLGLLTILANVAYYHDHRQDRALMLRFRKALPT